MIRIVDSQQEVMKLFSIMNKIPLVDMSPETCLARCLTGAYTCVVASESPGTLCILSYSIKVAHIVALYAPGQVRRYSKILFKFLSERGITTVTAVSTRDPDAYTILTGFTADYTHFSKEI